MAFNAGDIEAQLDLDRSPFNQSLKKAEADAKRMDQRRISMKVHLDEKALDQAIADTKRQGLSLPVDEEGLRQYLKSLKTAENETGNSAHRMHDRFVRFFFSPVGLQFATLPGLAAASAAASALALAGVPAIFAGIGIAAVKDNDRVEQSFKRTWNLIQTNVERMAGPLVPYLAKVADDISDSWLDMGVVLEQGFLGAGPALDNLADGLLRFTRGFLPDFTEEVLRSGPAMRGFASLLEDTGQGLGDFVSELGTDMIGAGQATVYLGRLIEVLLGQLGRLGAEFTTAWADVGDEVTETIDRLLTSFGDLLGGGLGAFGATLKVTLDVLNAILSVVGPLDSALGGMVGTVIGLAAAWKLFGSMIGGVGKAFNALTPTTWAKRLEPATAAVDRFGNSVVVATAGTSGMAGAGARLGGALTNLGRAAVTGLTWVPLLGAGLLGIKAAMDDTFPSADKLASALQQGGQAAHDAQMQATIVANGWGVAGLAGDLFAASAQEVNDALIKQRASMTEVERAQADLVKAQHDYQYAVDRFGANSPQAISAQENLADATNEVERAQDRAAKATEDHTDAVVRQTAEILKAIGSRVDYKGQLLELEDKEKKWQEAVKEGGKNSFEARKAMNDYEQQLLDTVDAIRKRVEAENASLEPTERNKLATAAMHQEIARLAVAAGSNLPPALAQMAASLTDAELKALGVTREVDKTGQAIYKLPPGKTLNFPTDAPIAQSQVDSLHRAIDSVPRSRDILFLIKTIIDPNSSANLPPFGLIPGRASGGPVSMGSLYRVNETGREYFVPSMNGTILSADKTDQMIGSQIATSRSTTATPAGSDGAWLDYEQLAGMVGSAVAAAIDGVRLRVDGNEWAYLVNGINTGNKRR